LLSADEVNLSATEYAELLKSPSYYGGHVEFKLIISTIFDVRGLVNRTEGSARRGTAAAEPGGEAQ
jgi:hypothetical protein